MHRSLSVAVAALLFISVAQAAWIDTIYTGTLSPTQVIPYSAAAPGFGGTFVCTLNRNVEPMTLACEVQSSVRSIASIQIHQGVRGQNGAVLYEFDNSFALGSHVKQTFTLEDLGNYPVAQQVTDFLSGGWYLGMTSGEYAGGSIRGQIEHIDRMYAIMDVTHTIPRASGSGSTGIALGTFSFFNPSRTLLDFVHSVQKATGVEIRFGRPGDVGPLVYFLSDPASDVFHSLVYTISEEVAFLDDLQYLQVLSQSNPSGEIRGQVVTIDYVPEIAFTARLDNSQAVAASDSNNRGCGLLAYDCASHVLEYLVMHNVPDANGAFLNSGAAGETGAAVFSLARDASPIYGSVFLTQEQEFLLYSQEMYFSISSPQFPSGEIRGQITADADWWAYLSGTNVVPPISTEAVGCATFFLDGEQNRILNYDITHSVTAPRAVTLNVGEEGENGFRHTIFPSFFSPVRGDSIVFDDDDLEAYVQEGMYISVLSQEYPSIGEVRGTIKRINPCTSNDDNTLTLSVSGIDGY